MNAQSPHKWWSTLKSAVFGLSLSLPPLVGEMLDWCASRLVRLICSQIILIASSPGSLDLKLTCHPSPRLTTFAFRSSEVRRLFLDLYLYGGTDPWGMFPHFLQRTANVVCLPRLSVVFRRLVRLGNFQACERQANVTQIPTGPQPSSVANYLLTSITSILSTVFDHLKNEILCHV